VKKGDIYEEFDGHGKIEVVEIKRLVSTNM
jgi:hypothetical protein